MVYEDQASGKAWAKRLTVGGTRDKAYNLCSNAKMPRVLFFKPGHAGIEPCVLEADARLHL